MNKKNNMIWMVFFVLVPQILLAQDAELYVGAPPEDSAFVRFVNASEQSKGWSITVVRNGETINYGEVTSYYVLKEGVYSFSQKNQGAQQKVGAGEFYTYVLTDKEGTLLVEDVIRATVSKSALYFYNFSDLKSVSLYAPEHETEIFSLIEERAVSRDINAVKLSLQVKTPDMLIKELSGVVLKKRAGVSIFVLGKEGNYRAVMVENKTSI